MPYCSCFKVIFTLKSLHCGTFSSSILCICVENVRHFLISTISGYYEVLNMLNVYSKFCILKLLLKFFEILLLCLSLVVKTIALQSALCLCTGFQRRWRRINTKGFSRVNNIVASHVCTVCSSLLCRQFMKMDGWALVL
jgi:hypothetical protein